MADIFNDKVYDSFVFEKQSIPGNTLSGKEFNGCTFINWRGCIVVYSRKDSSGTTTYNGKRQQHIW